MAGKTFSPRLLVSNEANAAASYRLISRDLEHIIACCDRLLETAPPLNPFKHDIRALICSALIAYRRCFNTGFRSNLNQHSVSELGAEYSEIHGFLIDLADKHLAHSVNEFEQCGITIHVAKTEDGTVHRSGIGSQISFTYEMSLKDVLRLRDLASLLLEQKINPCIEELQSRIKDHVGAMSDDEIWALPEGFPPELARANVGKARVWPSHRK